MARPRRRRKSRPQGGLGLLPGIALIALALIAAAGFAYVYLTAEHPPALDTATLCPQGGPHSTTVVLVDASDDLPAPAKRELATLLQDIAEDLPAYALLDIRVLDPENNSSRSLVALCNPGDGRGLSTWTANPVLARKRWLESFHKPVLEAIDQGLAAGHADYSPIMAAIQGIAIDRFTGKAVASGDKKLIIISDMIEHDSDYSQYAGDLTFDRYKRSPAYKKFSTDLHGAEVSIEYVQRLMKHPLDSVAHIRFWKEWIKDNDGHLRDVTRLQGAG